MNYFKKRGFGIVVSFGLSLLSKCFCDLLKSKRKKIAFTPGIFNFIFSHLFMKFYFEMF